MYYLVGSVAVVSWDFVRGSTLGINSHARRDQMPAHQNHIPALDDGVYSRSVQSLYYYCLSFFTSERDNELGDPPQLRALPPTPRFQRGDGRK